MNPKNANTSTRSIQYAVWYMLIACLLVTSCLHEGKDKTKDDSWMPMVLKTEKYIQQGKFNTGEGSTWKGMPDSLAQTGNTSLYSGTPGVVLFYLELYNATKNKAFLDEATSGADYLINTLSDSIPGLYTGLSGVGFTLKEMYKTTNQQKYRDAVIKTLELLETTADSTENGIHWNHINDIVYGSAGIGLFLQDTYDDLKLKKADHLSVQIAEGLLDVGIDTLHGIRWAFFPSYPKYMDNFSHGTAGVAYFLSETYQRTGNKKYLDAALKAAELLLEVANKKGFIPHHFPGGEDLYYLSWCHGPPGTARLFYSLYLSTGDKKWLETIKTTANNLMNEGIEKKTTPGYWNNVGKCCGATGVAEYYLWLHRLTGNEAYLDFSNQMTQHILESGTQTNGAMKWVHAENRTSPMEIAAQTGLMQGSAGIGMWLLKLRAYERAENYRIHFPDEPKIAEE